IFDVSHMGRLKVTGKGARRLLERLCTRRISDMQAGQCRYTFMANDRGGIRDDVIVYRIDEDDFRVVVNCSNREKILAHIGEVTGDLSVKIDDLTFKTAMVALQGPRVMETISNFSKEIPALKRYRFVEKSALMFKVMVSRTGYTGEDGVEVIMPSGAVTLGMKMLMKDTDLNDPNTVFRPAGLGARDTLRLEAGMPLYGNDLGEDISALANGMSFALTLDKDEDEGGEAYVGMEALKKERDAGGPRRLLVGMEIDGKRTARQHMMIRIGDREVGEVTSGCASPTLEKSIAMGYVDRDHSAVGTDLSIDTGRARLDARVVALPFYKK
ncbi:MAG: glycine cleavage system aminomethyltransferase GcvT, partial [Phycisphaerales bacterium]|nr:glycine cleavage system aminomethyltransferase GcvT [Phycisphaerales bacterium]